MDKIPPPPGWPSPKLDSRADIDRIGAWAAQQSKAASAAAVADLKQHGLPVYYENPADPAKTIKEYSDGRRVAVKIDADGSEHESDLA